MGLKDTLTANMRTALKAKDTLTLGVTRSILGEITAAEKAGKSERALTEAEIQALISKEATKRLDTATIYEDSGYADRAQTERAEAALLKTYLPAEKSDEELTTSVRDAIATTGATSKRDMGKVIKAVMAQEGMNLYGKRISAIAQTLL